MKRTSMQDLADCNCASSTKKKDVATNRLRTQLMFSHWYHQSASNKWWTIHQFDTCWSRSQGHWGVL